MFRFTQRLIAVASIACGFAPVADAQERTLPIGTWSGTVRRLAPARTANPAPAALVVAKVKDPHVRWRGGAGEMVTVTLRLQQQTFEVGSVELTDSRLSLTFTHPEQGMPMQCVLLRQKDGSYEGDCTGALSRRVILTPPPADKP